MLKKSPINDFEIKIKQKKIKKKKIILLKYNFVVKKFKYKNV